ncbi:MAG: hypothetical protein Q9212_002353 [Teloschistes hypoglaucus]
MENKSIIVTGASRGIGYAIAEYLVNNSHNVVLVARSADLLESLRVKSPNQVAVCVGDVSNDHLAEKAVETARSRFGRLDGLVLNHGVLEPTSRIADSDVQAWRSNFDVNFFSLVAMIKAALPSLRQNSGRVIFTSSGASTKAYSCWGAYGASKAAMNHLNLTLAAEEQSVTCVSIRPGVVDTQMQQNIRDVHSASMDEKDVIKFKTAHEKGRLVKPDQPGHVIAKLVVSAPQRLSGQFLDWTAPELADFQSN